MYIIVNNKNNKVCAEWSHLNHNDIHICWKTYYEIESANSYRSDNTHVKKFNSKYDAEQFASNYFEDNDLEIISTNLIQRYIDQLIEKIKYESHHTHIHHMY